MDWARLASFRSPPFRVELGRGEFSSRSLLHLEIGNIIELNHELNESLVIYVGDERVALGEPVHVGGHFGVKIIRLVEGAADVGWPCQIHGLIGQGAARFADLVGERSDEEPLLLRVELGRADSSEELEVGRILQLDKLVGSVVDVYAGERIIARGEVLLLNDNLCVRATEIVRFDDAG